MTIDDLIGIPFAENGRGPEAYDCWGLACAVYRLHGLSLPQHQQDTFDPAAIAAAIERGSRDPRWLPLPGPEPLAIIPIRRLIGGHGYVTNHLGVCLGGGVFIHALRHHGVRLDDLDSPLWRAAINGYWRYHG